MRELYDVLRDALKHDIRGAYNELTSAAGGAARGDSGKEIAVTCTICASFKIRGGKYK